MNTQDMASRERWGHVATAFRKEGPSRGSRKQLQG